MEHLHILIILNSAYFIVTIGLLIQDILWLRILFIFAEILMISYGFISDNLSIAIWNILFMFINIFRTGKLLLDKRNIEIPEDIQIIYNKIFYEMSKKDFIFFWNIGKQIKYQDNIFLSKEKNKQHELIILLKGNAIIKKNNEIVATIQPNEFIGEFSFLTGEESSIDIVSLGEIQFMVWSQNKIDTLKKLNPTIYNHLYIAISREIAKTLSTKYL